MKLTKISNLIMLGLTLTIAAAGCKTKKPGPITVLPNGMKTPAPGTDQGPVTSSRNGPPPIDRVQPLPTSQDNVAVQAPPTPVSPPQNPPIDVGKGVPPNLDSHIGWPEDPSALKDQTTYFDFDKSSIKASEQSKLDAVADYLKAHPGTAVRIEGNCDERGTEEYNRSLGERRALSGREYLARLGIEPGRVDTITYGEDRPAATGHDEAAWSKNRRDDFILLTPPK